MNNKTIKIKEFQQQQMFVRMRRKGAGAAGGNVS
jgi:hypothetical protein